MRLSLGYIESDRGLGSCEVRIWKHQRGCELGKEKQPVGAAKAATLASLPVAAKKTPAISAPAVSSVVSTHSAPIATLRSPPAAVMATSSAAAARTSVTGATPNLNASTATHSNASLSLFSRRIPRKQQTTSQPAATGTGIQLPAAETLKAKRKATQDLSETTHSLKRAAVVVPTVNSSSAAAMESRRKSTDELTRATHSAKRAAAAVPTVNSSSATAVPTANSTLSTVKAAKKTALKHKDSSVAAADSSIAAAEAAMPAVGRSISTNGLSSLTPMAKKAASKKAAAKKIAAATINGFPVGSTGAHYSEARARDDRRVSKKDGGKSRHQFEVRARGARAEWRASNKKNATVDTPYGPVNLSRGRFGDPAPKITTQKSKYGDKSVGDTYKAIVTSLVAPDKYPDGARSIREREVAKELLGAIEHDRLPTSDRVIAGGEQFNAAAKLLAITHIAEPERVGGSSKHARAVLREIAAGQLSFMNAFVGGGKNFPDFVIAKNPTAARQSLDSSQNKNEKFRDRTDFFSDSSDKDA